MENTYRRRRFGDVASPFAIDVVVRELQIVGQLFHQLEQLLFMNSHEVSNGVRKEMMAGETNVTDSRRSLTQFELQRCRSLLGEIC